MSYASCETNRAGTPAGGARHSAVRAVLSLGLRTVSNFLEVWRGRREIARLAQLDDRLLADMGLTRADVDWALMRPLSMDPSDALAIRLERRKAAARWARTFWAS